MLKKTKLTQIKTPCNCKWFTNARMPKIQTQFIKTAL